MSISPDSETLDGSMGEDDGYSLDKHFNDGTLISEKHITNGFHTSQTKSPLPRSNLSLRPIGVNGGLVSHPAVSNGSIYDSTGSESVPIRHDGDKLEPIAIIGMSFRGPQDATSPNALWNMLSEGRSAWTRVPMTRFNAESFQKNGSSRSGLVDHPILPLSPYTKAELVKRRQWAFHRRGLSRLRRPVLLCNCDRGSNNGSATEMVARDRL